MSFEVFPYSNFHEMNLDWIISEIKKVIEEWAETKITWEELKKLVENFLASISVDIAKEVSKKLEEMKNDGTLAELLANNLNIVQVVDTTEEMINMPLKDGQIVITRGYYEIGDFGGAVFYIGGESLPASVTLKSFRVANILNNGTVRVEQLGVKRNETRQKTPVPGNGALFNKALEKAKWSERSVYNFKLVGDGYYYTDETLNFGGSSTNRLSVDTFQTDFSEATIFTDKPLESLISINSVFQIDFKFGYLNAETCNYAIKMFSLERLDWSQYVWIECKNATAKQYSVYIENNDKGGWVNEIHFTKGLYPNGFYVNCPNEVDEVFVTNKLSGFYFTDISCEGTNDAWFKFKNTHDVYIKNCRTHDVNKKWLVTEGICNYIKIEGFFNTNMFTLDNRTENLFLFGMLTVPEQFASRNPIFTKGYWYVDLLPVSTYMGNGGNFVAGAGNFAPTIFYLRGNCSNVKLPKIYSDYAGINRMTIYVSSDATGTVYDGYSKAVINCENYRDKTVDVIFAGSSWWVVD